MPITVRRSIEILGLLGLGYIVVHGADIIMPLIMAVFLALMLLPVYRFLRRHRVPEVLAIALCLVVLVVVIGAIGVFLSFQVASLLNDIPKMQQNLNAHWQTISGWIADKWNIPVKRQLAIINEQVKGIGGNVAGTLQGAALSLTNILVFVGLVPIYIFLILFYKEQIRQFILCWFKRENHDQVADAFHEMQVMTKYYLVSLLIQISYLTVLVGGILLLFGIKHALLIGIAFGILNLIPYIGALIGNLLGVVITLTSSQQLWQIWAVLGTIAFVQFLDNNILMPRIVGSKVKINSLASIVGIVIGGAMAGVSGMFLSIPVMAVLKIIFDRVPILQQWGVLLGEPATAKKPGKTPLKELKANMENKRNDEIDDNKNK